MPDLIISSMTDERLVALARNPVLSAEFVLSDKFVKDTGRIHYRPIPNPRASMRSIYCTCGRDKDIG